jgi:hypothetical protein
MSQNQPNYGEQISETFKQGYDTVADTITQSKDQLNEGIESFSKDVDEASTTYLQSNTIVAKFSFLLLVIILFMFLLRIGISLLIYFTSSSEDPYVIRGLINGTESVIISQDPKDANSVPIYRSNNESEGLEFTWSLWLYLNDVGNDANKYQHIFSKGSTDFSTTTSVAKVNNSPGLYLGPANNNLHIVMSTVKYNDVNTELDIDNIPIKNWVHVVIRMKNTVLDTYVNGTISGRVVLDHVPKQNYQDVMVNQNGGFSGKLSDLRYFSRALNVFEINSIVNNGPNLETSEYAEGATSGTSYYGYLSNLWYTSKL